MAKTPHPCAADCPERSAECKTKCERYLAFWEAQHIGYREDYDEKEKKAALDAVQWRGLKRRK